MVLFLAPLQGISYLTMYFQLMEIDEELNIKLIVRILLKGTKRQKKH